VTVCCVIINHIILDGGNEITTTSIVDITPVYN
jgi:hypothetical protein